jgi:HPt (histidine-containing phosphotransfer) domain-containing protein
LVGGGSTLATRLVDVFLARVPTDLADRRGAVDRGDAAAVGHLAHRLKGAAAILGVKAMIGLCQELQLLAHAGALTPARDLVRPLEEESDRVGTAPDAVVPRR